MKRSNLHKAILLAGLPGLVFCLILFTTCKHSLPPAPDSTAPDTTSHAFTWQIETLGDGNSSMLYDVAIIDDNDVWAVGEIYLKDSTGQFIYPTYNAAHWDGNSWHLLRVPVRDYGNLVSAFPLKTIFAFGPDDVWVAGDADLIHWDGSSWQSKAFFITELPFNGQVVKIWGTSGSNLYMVGRNGAIYHFNGASWQTLDSGTDLDFRDIWGAVNEKTGELEILAVAGKPRLAFPKRKIFKLTDNTVETIADSGIAQASMSGVWFSPGEKYVVVGNGIYRKNHLDEPLWIGRPLELTEFFSVHVRGIAANDFIVIGAFGDLLHYNGSTWGKYPELRRKVSFTRIAFTENRVFASGRVGNRAAVVIGRRH